MSLTEPILDSEYDESTQQIIKKAFRKADSFVGMRPNEYIFPVEVEIGDFDFLSLTANFSLREKSQGVVGIIHFNPNELWFRYGGKYDEDAMEISLLEERLHAIHAMINPDFLKKNLEIRTLRYKRRELVAQGITSNTEVAEIFATHKQLEDRIRKVASYFDIPLEDPTNNEESLDNALRLSFANYDMDISALVYLAEYFCERFGIDKTTIPKYKSENLNPERDQKIYISAFIRKILKEPAYFPTRESKLKLIDEFNIGLDYSVDLRTQIMGYFLKNVPIDFKSKASSFIENCNSLNILMSIGDSITPFVPPKDLMNYRVILNKAFSEFNLGDSKKYLKELIGLIPQVDGSFATRFIDKIIDGEDRNISLESLANAIAFYQFGDLPADPIARKSLLSNKAYTRMLADALNNDENSPLKQSGFNVSEFVVNTNDKRVAQSIGSESSIMEQLDLSPLPKLIKNNTESIWSHLSHINSRRILQHKNRNKEETESIIELEMEIAKLKNEMDVMAEPIAKIVKYFIKFGEVNEGGIYSELLDYSDLFKMSEPLLRGFIHSLSELVRGGNKQRLRDFLKLSSFISQLHFFGIEG